MLMVIKKAMNYEIILTNVAKHIQLTAEETDSFLSLLQPRNLKKKEFLLWPGDAVRHTNFINKGCLRVYQLGENGQEHIATFAITDWWVSDLAAFLSQSPATNYIEALEDTELFQIEKNDLDKLYKEVPKFERLFRILHQNAFVAHHQRLMQNITQTAEERYLGFRNRFPDLELRIPQKHIAAYIGVTPEFLSMLRRKLVKKKS
jgi:CRP-like cAMP-binding protein